MTRRGLLLVGCLAGIGFTMSIFVAGLAFAESPLLDTAKMAVIVASTTAALLGLWVGRFALRAGAVGRQAGAPLTRSSERRL